MKYIKIVDSRTLYFDKLVHAIEVLTFLRVLKRVRFISIELSKKLILSIFQVLHLSFLNGFIYNLNNDKFSIIKKAREYCRISSIMLSNPKVLFDIFMAIPSIDFLCLTKYLSSKINLSTSDYYTS